MCLAFLAWDSLDAISQRRGERRQGAGSYGTQPQPRPDSHCRPWSRPQCRLVRCQVVITTTHLSHTLEEYFQPEACDHPLALFPGPLTSTKERTWSQNQKPGLFVPETLRLYLTDKHRVTLLGG